MAKIKIGVIGLGRMGRVYGYHVGRQIEAATLAAVADSQAEVLQKFSSEFANIKTYSGYQDLLNDKDVQAVIIATPTSTHREVVIAAAQAGKAIFCEKPTALTLAATDEMLAAVNQAGVLFQVGFMRRFDRAYEAAKAHIDNGVIGDPITVRSISRDPFRTSLEYANPAVSGGIIVDMGIHDFDIIRWMMNDEVVRVHTESASLKYPELLDVNDVDNAMMNVKFAKGGLGNVEVSRTAPYGYDIQCTIVGTKATLQVGYLQETPVLIMDKDYGVRHDVVPHFPERFGKAYTAQVEHFVDCLTGKAQPRLTPHDARAALQVSLAAFQSQRTGQIVNVAEVT